MRKGINFPQYANYLNDYIKCMAPITKYRRFELEVFLLTHVSQSTWKCFNALVYKSYPKSEGKKRNCILTEKWRLLLASMLSNFINNIVTPLLCTNTIWMSFLNQVKLTMIREVCIAYMYFKHLVQHYCRQSSLSLELRLPFSSLKFYLYRIGKVFE